MPQVDLLHVVDGVVRTDMLCTSCKLSDNIKLTTNRMLGHGPSNPDLMFIGKAPAIEDDTQGEVYSGKGGDILRSLMREAELEPDEYYYTNCLKCCTFGDKVKGTNFKKCKGHLLKEISDVKPKAIVAVGTEAIAWLAGKGGQKKLRRHAVPCLINSDIPVFSIAQPAALYHAQEPYKTKLKNAMIRDLAWIAERVKTGNLKQTDIPVDYKTAETIEDVEAFLAEFEDTEEIACDLETTALYPHEGEVCVAIGFSKGAGHGRAIPLYAWGMMTLHYWTDEDLDNTILPLIKAFLLRHKFYGHNFLQFDQKWIRHTFDIDYLDIVDDTQLKHHLYDEERGTHKLEQLALLFTTMAPWKEEVAKMVKDTPRLCQYLCKDVDATARVRIALEDELTEKQKVLLHQLIVPVAHTFMDMEWRGVHVDYTNLDQLAEFLKEKLALAQDNISKMPEVQAFELEHNTRLNVDSHKHLAAIMENYFKYPCVKRTGGNKYSTDRHVLEALADKPFVHEIQKTRGLSKLKGTYCEGLRKRIHSDDKLHTNFLLHGTVTGRPASRDPNLQNIPRKDTAGKVLEDGAIVKDIFTVPKEHVLLQADYSQAELRTLAMYTLDPALIDTFCRGLDIHAMTAAKAYEIPIEEVLPHQRTNAKHINFGIIYGMHETSLIHSFIAAGSTEAEARKFLINHKAMFPKVWKWMALQETTVRSVGEQETFFGRKRRYKYVDDHAIRQAYNFPIQSTASDFLLYGLLRCDRLLKGADFVTRPLLTVHDSIVFQVPMYEVWDVAELIKETMENLNFPFMNVPMNVDLEVGYTWGKLKKIDVETKSINY